LILNYFSFSVEQALEQKQVLTFGYELFHYGYIACKAGQLAKTEECFTKLIRLGLSPRYFATLGNTVIDSFFQSERGIDLFQKASQIPILETVNQDLREKIYQRRLQDQYYRLTPNGY
jgi:hypothetical protein